jgi:hypothetical protein
VQSIIPTNEMDAPDFHRDHKAGAASAACSMPHFRCAMN